MTGYVKTVVRLVSWLNANFSSWNHNFVSIFVQFLKLMCQNLNQNEMLPVFSVILEYRMDGRNSSDRPTVRS